MTARTGVLVLAKAPVPGLAKTRVATDVGSTAAADIAAACLLDTLDVVDGWVAGPDRAIALEGDLTVAARGGEISERLRTWCVFDQRGVGLGERIFNAHADATRHWGDRMTVVQVGMDTPAMTADALQELAWPVAEGFTDASLGLAVDGGWWGLATRDLSSVRSIIDVPTSRSDTGSRTLSALAGFGASVGLGRVLRDVDTLEDAVAVAEAIPCSRLAEAMQRFSAASR